MKNMRRLMKDMRDTEKKCMTHIEYKCGDKKGYDEYSDMPPAFAFRRFFSERPVGLTEVTGRIFA